MSEIRIWITCLFALVACSSVWSQIPGDEYPESSKQTEKGVALYSEKRYDESLAEFQKVAQGDSLYPEAAFGSLFPLFELQRYEDVVAICEELLRNPNKNRMRIFLLKVEALEKLGRKEEAGRVMDEVISEFPISHQPHFEKSVFLLSMMDDHSAAWEEALKAFELNRYHGGSHRVIGQIADASGQPALACMAYFMAAVMYADRTEFVMSMMSRIESLAKDQSEIESAANPPDLAFAASLEGINQIILSQVALKDSFKSKVKVPYTYTRVMQIICEKLPPAAPDAHPLLRFYTDYYRMVWNEGHFAGMVYQPISGVDSPELRKLASANKKKIDAFVDATVKFVTSRHVDTPYVLDGEPRTGQFFAAPGGLKSIGSVDEKQLRNGLWIEFYSNGVIEVIGNYSHGLPVGEFRIYHDNGVLSQLKTFNESGEPEGIVKFFDPRGIITSSEVMKNGVNAGESVWFGPGGLRRRSIFMEGEKANGKVINYDEYGNPDKEMTAVQDVIQKDYVDYYPSGAVEARGTILNGKLSGPYEEFFESGEKKSEGTFTAGDRTGMWTSYHRNGQIAVQGAYEANRAEGTWKEYGEDGQIIEEYAFRMGKMDGPNRYYDRNGVMYREEVFRNGKSVVFRYFDHAGAMISELEVTAGKVYFEGLGELRRKISEGSWVKEAKEGEWKYYHPNGLLKSTEINVKGVVSGPGTFYRENGTRSGVYHYRDDQLDGYYEEYHASGAISETGYFRMGSLHGPMRQYSEDGVLRREAFFWKGELNGWDRNYSPSGKLRVNVYMSFGVPLQSISYDEEGNPICEVTLPGGSGLWFNCHQNGARRFEVERINGQKVGKSTDFHGNGVASSQLEFVHGRMEGPYASYHFNGQVHEAGNYLFGEKSGEWKSYDWRGQVVSRKEYRDGNLEGAMLLYYDGGAIRQERSYRRDLRDGYTTTYAPGGAVVIRMRYEQGVALGYSYQGKDGVWVPEIPITGARQRITAFYPNGRKSTEFTLENNQYVEDFTRWNPDGSLLYSEESKNGMTHGKARHYHANGKLWEDEEYAFDSLHGKCVYYYQDGRKEAELTYVSGELDGPAIYYDKSGNVVAEGRYLDGHYFPGQP